MPVMNGMEMMEEVMKCIRTRVEGMEAYKESVFVLCTAQSEWENKNI